MLIITVYVDAPEGQAMEVKESLAMFLERFGDTKVVNVEERPPKQMKIGGMQNGRSIPNMSKMR